ncbi:hypothetical protein FQR65_LT13391 [Abscondita terminalis]|nr:hypothetical protein FQR65_LT13391 [Abscondita terminalis]
MLNQSNPKQRLHSILAFLHTPMHSSAQLFTWLQLTRWRIDVNSVGGVTTEPEDLHLIAYGIKIEIRVVGVHRDGTIAGLDWTAGGRPPQTSQVRVKDSESVDSLSLPPLSSITAAASLDDIPNQVLEELYTVFKLELPHTVYIPFLKQIGLNSIELALKNHVFIRSLYRDMSKVRTRDQINVYEHLGYFATLELQ